MDHLNEKQIEELTIGQMTDRELLVAIFKSQIRMENIVTQFLNTMQKNPMLQIMAGKMTGR